MSKEYILAAIDDGMDVDDLNFYTVEDRPWTSDGKYEYRSDIVEITPDTPHLDDDYPELIPGYYEITYSRSGSYFTDYEYGDTYVIEVEPYEVTETKYRPKKREG